MTNNGKGGCPGQSCSPAGFALAGEGQHLKSGLPASPPVPEPQSPLCLWKPYALSLSRLPNFSKVPVLLILKESESALETQDLIGKTASLRRLGAGSFLSPQLGWASPRLQNTLLHEIWRFGHRVFKL